MLRILLSLLFLSLSNLSWANSVENLRFFHSDAKTRIVFDLSAEVNYKSFTLQNPDRLVIDIQDTQSASLHQLPDLTGTPVKNIRYAKRNKNTLRIVLDLDKPLDYETQVLPPNQDKIHRLVLDLIDNNSSDVIVTKKIEKIETQPVVEKVENKVIPQTPTVHKTVKTQAKARRDIIIAIDAGHGGKDPGAIGYRGTKEKDIVLSIARRLAKLVDQEPGMKSYLTRNSDKFIGLRQRMELARQQKADMFISIHADAFHNKQAKGSSVYVLSKRGASSAAAQMLADKENAADLVGGITLDDKDELLASVLLDLSQTASLEASLEVADTVLSGLRRVGHVHKKNVESAAFVVLKSPDIPSVLVETAFISNPEEEQKLNTSRHQDKLATAMMSGVRNYFQRNPPLENQLDNQQHIVSRGDTLSTIAQRYQVSLAQLKTNNALTTNRLQVGDVLLIP
jgi:N-acetylmuramoyl-L-alanine amidase